MFWAEIIDDTYRKDQAHRHDRRVVIRNAEITYRSPPTQRRGDDKIRHQQERTSGREESTMLSRRGINATAIGKMGADNNVVVPHHRGENANSENDWQGRKTCGDESETDHIRFARAPVAIEQRGGPFPIDIPWAMHAWVTEMFRSAIALGVDSSSRAPRVTSAFLEGQVGEV